MLARRGRWSVAEAPDGIGRLAPGTRYLLSWRVLGSPSVHAALSPCKLEEGCQGDGEAGGFYRPCHPGYA